MNCFSRPLTGAGEAVAWEAAAVAEGANQIVSAMMLWSKWGICCESNAINDPDLYEILDDAVSEIKEAQ